MVERTQIPVLQGDIAGMSGQEFSKQYERMRSYVDWSDSDAERVAALWPIVAPAAPALIEDFYAEIQRQPEALRVITGGTAQIERLSQTLREWLAQLFSGIYDDEYVARRWRVGHRHVEIGLAQRFTSLALARLRVGMTNRICAGWKGSAAELAASMNSLNKLLDLDLALIQDAYEHEHVERERRIERARGERRFRHLVENASCLIVILDAEAQAIYFNPYAEATTGYTADEMRQRGNEAVALLGSSLPEAKERLAAALSGAAPARFETEIAHPRGQARWISWTLSRIGGDDEPAALAVGHDVTEERRTASRLLQASRLATIGEMYARLAHESRNALQRMQFCTEMLAEELTGSPHASELLKRSEVAQHDLHRLLDEVRNFASPIALERTECRLSILWREAWNLLQNVRRERRAELVELPGADGRAAMRLDRFRMVQAFRNLFENALAACNDPVQVSIDCREIDAEGGRWVEIVVEDNGPGFGKQALERAFEPFFTTRTTGTGLGLAIVKRIAEAHGGEAVVENVVGGGARIVLRLPEVCGESEPNVGDGQALDN